MTKIQRLKKLCKWLIYIGYADNEADLASKIGYTKSSFSQIINEKVPISPKFIEKICSVNENINKVWINTGEGELLLDKTESLNELSEPNPDYKKEFTYIDQLLEKIKFQTEQITWYQKQLEYLSNQLIAKKNLNKKNIEEVFNKLNEIESSEESKSIK